MTRHDFIIGLANEEGFTPEERENIIQVSLDNCDWITKSIVIMEELSELAKEVSKGARNEGRITDLLQEMADVNICLTFLKSHYGITDNMLQDAIDVKLRREYARIIKEGKTND